MTAILTQIIFEVFAKTLEIIDVARGSEWTRQIVVGHHNVLWISCNVNDFRLFVHHTWRHQRKWQMRFNETRWIDVRYELVSGHTDCIQHIVICRTRLLLAQKFLLHFIVHEHTESVDEMSPHKTNRIFFFERKGKFDYLLKKRWSLGQ